MLLSYYTKAQEVKIHKVHLNDDVQANKLLTKDGNIESI